MGLRGLFSEEARELRSLEKEAEKVMGYDAAMAKLSDEELRNKTTEFRERLANGETTDDIRDEAFAVAREAASRVLNEKPYKVQIMGSLVLDQGDIAELKTGEGKTLTATMAVYLNALQGQGVHVITVNEYLAGRDAAWMGEIYRFLGMSVGVNKRELSPREKREAYECDITYTTNSELGFDYLRDNMVTDVRERVMRGLHTAFIDEVDSVLVDESRTPLIISGGKKKTANLYIQADSFVKTLEAPEYETDKYGEKTLLSGDYDIDEKTRQVMLSEDGVRKAEEYFGIDNLYDLEHTQLVHHINQALKANYIMMREVEYVVSDEQEIVIVDQFTGRTMPGRAYSDGLHQAIEAKEGVPVKEETSTLATITYQNFFRLYEKLAGMTGTAKTEEEEFLNTYNMKVIVIPTNRPIQRQDLPDEIYAFKDDKYRALVRKVHELYDKGQPVLVGTVAVETSELISNLLKQEGIPHEVLNAKNHAREAEIIAKAGRPKSVTIATNMAGRGTDIKLTEESRRLGGLAVLGSERHESRRIDNQLRGRSGRQGDPGESRFYLSLEDDLMRLFNTQLVARVMAKGMPEGEPIESKSVSKGVRNAQKAVESRNFEIRKNVLKYDDVMNKQRTVIYAERQAVLKGEDIHEDIEMFISDTVASYVHGANRGSDKPKDWDWAGMVGAIKELFPTTVTEDDARKAAEGLKGDKAAEAVKKLFVDDALNQYDQFEDRLGEEGLRTLERRVVLAVLDRKWREHLYEMDYLKDGIGLRGMGQRDPLVEYQREGYQMYNSMIEAIKEESVQLLFHIDLDSVAQTEDHEDIQQDVRDDQAVDQAEVAMGDDIEEQDEVESDETQLHEPEEPDQRDDHADEVLTAANEESIKEAYDDNEAIPESGLMGPAPISHAEGKVPASKRPKNEELKTPWADGRTFPGTPKNAPCPCGSGRKYKMCHGQNEQ